MKAFRIIVGALAIGMLIVVTPIITPALANDDTLNTEVTKKSEEDLPDPNRPYYDGQGDMYDYQGNLIEAASTADGK